MDKNGNRIMRDEFYLDGLNCEPYSFDALPAVEREYQKDKNKNEIKSHHYIISFDHGTAQKLFDGETGQELGLEYAKANFRGIRHWSVRTWTVTMAAATFMYIS